ncbi:MAG: pyridoxal-dependent decarboxylase, exosortase A system-associated [Pseudomonadota bacterium]
MKTKSPSRSIERLPQNENGLLINGIPVEAVIARAGQTPLYAYDRALIDQRIAALRQALPQSISLHYAIKANPMPAVCAHLVPLVDGFDVASKGELITVLNAGANPHSVSFAGPGKTDDELVAAIASKICVSVESRTELARCAKLARHLNTRARICLRVNPNFELKQSGMKMTGLPSQFGIDVNEVEDIVASQLPDSVQLVGVQIYSGSQNLNAEALIETAGQTFNLAAELQGRANTPFKFINVGGGFGIPYFAHEQSFDLHAVGAALAEHLAAHRTDFKETEVIIELGRYIVGEAGYYITSVVDIKQSRGKKFAIVDGGLHHHLANSGNFGQTLRRNYPVFVANKLNLEMQEKITIVGPLCTPLDIVASDLTVPELEVGDRIVVLQSGAYGLSASPLRFLGHPEPVELLV